MRSSWLVAVLVCMAVVGARAAQCNCNCPRNMPVCGKDSTGDVDTFPSECALRCFNCTFGKDYFVTKRGACSAMDHRRGRRSAPVWTRSQGSAPGRVRVSRS